MTEVAKKQGNANNIPPFLDTPEGRLRFEQQLLALCARLIN